MVAKPGGSGYLGKQTARSPFGTGSIRTNQAGIIMAHNSRQRLLRLFEERAVSFGRFTLASGKESTYYINSKKAIFNAEAIWLLGDALWEATKDLNIQGIGGLEVGAIPMATAAAL